MTQKRRASSAGRISLHSGKTGFAARPAFHGAHGPAPWRGSPRSAVLALPAAAKGPGKEGARPQNSPLPLAAFPLPPSPSVPLIQPAPQPTAPVEQKPIKKQAITPAQGESLLSKIKTSALKKEGGVVPELYNSCQCWLQPAAVKYHHRRYQKKKKTTHTTVKAATSPQLAGGTNRSWQHFSHLSL